MKIWVDTTVPAPKPYYWDKDADDVIATIKASDRHIDRAVQLGRTHFLNRDYAARNK